MAQGELPSGWHLLTAARPQAGSCAAAPALPWHEVASHGLRVLLRSQTHGKARRSHMRGAWAQHRLWVKLSPTCSDMRAALEPGAGTVTREAGPAREGRARWAPTTPITTHPAPGSGHPACLLQKQRDKEETRGKGKRQERDRVRAAEETRGTGAGRGPPGMGS